MHRDFTAFPMICATSAGWTCGLRTFARSCLVMSNACTLRGDYEAKIIRVLVLFIAQLLVLQHAHGFGRNTEKTVLASFSSSRADKFEVAI
jgi:hypothetical protein